MGTKKSITENAMGLSLNATVCEMVDLAREAAEKIPIFAESGNGAIVFMAVPQCRDIDVWLGNLSVSKLETGELVDVNKYMTVRTIKPGGSHTIMWKDPSDGHIEPVNCFAYAMAKIAYLSRLVNERIPSRDDDPKMDDFLEENGYSSHKGAICVMVYYCGNPVVRFYIAFSGAAEDEDQVCADETAMKTIEYLREQLPSEDFDFYTHSVEGCGLVE